ncbi:hypothetical protein TWF730_007576 [Orbilia blumenaviensis]|uniref:Uncharacterized protein n=1 Tax=Orbilia blumenaviensis TaxID=1796055 RepID=A0AAV9VAS0_9PEZI
MLLPKWMMLSCPSLAQVKVADSTTSVEPIRTPVQDIDYFALHKARKPLEEFAHTVDYVERLYRKIYPYKPPIADIKPSDIVDGVRLVDVIFEYLLRGFRYRLSRVGTLLQRIKEDGGLPDEGLGQADIHTYGFKNEEQALELLPRLEMLYDQIKNEKSRVPGIHRWIRSDLTNGDLRGWESDVLLVARSAIGAAVDFDPNYAVFDPSHQGVSVQCLKETGRRLKVVKNSIDEMWDIFHQNPVLLAKTTSFDFNFDLGAHLMRLSDWFGGWHNGVGLLLKSYTSIPHYLPGLGDDGSRYFKEEYFSFPSELEISETEVCAEETTAGRIPQTLFHHALNCKPTKVKNGLAGARNKGS